MKQFTISMYASKEDLKEARQKFHKEKYSKGTCGRCEHWRDDDSCNVNLGVCYEDDKECRIVDRIVQIKTKGQAALF